MKLWQRFLNNGLKNILYPALLAGSTVVPFNLRAQNHSHTLKKSFSGSDTLKEVQVKGLKPSLRNASVTPVQVLKGSQLEKLNNLSVADAIRYFTGVQLKDYGGIGGLKTINVRSMGSNQTAVFYDGVQLGNAQNGQVDLGKFSLDNIEEIDLYNAQKSNIFQPARGFAAASALYIQSKVPVFNPGERDNLKASFKTGSFGQINPSVLWQHELGKNTYSTFSSEWQKANGRYRFRYTNSVYDTTATRQNGDINAFRAEGALFGTLADSSKWSVRIYQYLSGRGLPRAIVSNNFESADRQSDRNTFIQAGWQNPQGERYELMLAAKYAYDYMRYLRPDYDNIEGRMDNRYRQQELYFSAAGRYHLMSKWDAALAADLLINKLNSTMDYFSYPTRYTKLLALSSDFHTGRLTLQGSVLGTFVNETVKEYTAPADKKQFTPSLTASWQPFAQNSFSLRGFYKSIFRLPTFNDLYYTFAGNTALQPEYAKQYDAGFTWRKNFSRNFWQNLSLQADAYFNRVTDKIVAVPGENIATWMMMNLGKADIKGVEATLGATAKAGRSVILNAGLNYTFQQALDITNASDYNYRHQIPYTPRHSGSFILGAEWNDAWISYSYIYTGERYSQKANIPENYMEPWYTHDISASRRFTSGKTGYKVTGEVNNLFNQYRDVVLNFPMPGRSYRLTLSMNY